MINKKLQPVYIILNVISPSSDLPISEISNLGELKLKYFVDTRSGDPGYIIYMGLSDFEYLNVDSFIGNIANIMMDTYDLATHEFRLIFGELPLNDIDDKDIIRLKMAEFKEMLGQLIDEPLIKLRCIISYAFQRTIHSPLTLYMWGGTHPPAEIFTLTGWMRTMMELSPQKLDNIDENKISSLNKFLDYKTYELIEKRKKIDQSLNNQLLIDNQWDYPGVMSPQPTPPEDDEDYPLNEYGEYLYGNDGDDDDEDDDDLDKFNQFIGNNDSGEIFDFGDDSEDDFGDDSEDDFDDDENDDYDEDGDYNFSPSASADDKLAPDSVRKYNMIITSKKRLKHDKKTIKEFINDFMPNEDDDEDIENYKDILLDRWVSAFAISKAKFKKFKAHHNKKKYEMDLKRNNRKSAFYDARK